MKRLLCLLRGGHLPFRKKARFISFECARCGADLADKIVRLS